MSLVGPRPHAIAHNELYRKLINGYMIRHKVRPASPALRRCTASVAGPRRWKRCPSRYATIFGTCAMVGLAGHRDPLRALLVVLQVGATRLAYAAAIQTKAESEQTCASRAGVSGSGTPPPPEASRLPFVMEEYQAGLTTGPCHRRAGSRLSVPAVMWNGEEHMPLAECMHAAPGRRRPDRPGTRRPSRRRQC